MRYCLSGFFPSVIVTRVRYTKKYFFHQGLLEVFKQTLLLAFHTFWGNLKKALERKYVLSNSFFHFTNFNRAVVQNCICRYCIIYCRWVFLLLSHRAEKGNNGFRWSNADVLWLPNDFNLKRNENLFSGVLNMPFTSSEIRDPSFFAFDFHAKYFVHVVHI